MASAVDKQPAAARLATVAAAGYLPTDTNESQSSYTTCGDTTPTKMTYIRNRTASRSKAHSYRDRLEIQPAPPTEKSRKIPRPHPDESPRFPPGGTQPEPAIFSLADPLLRT